MLSFVAPMLPTLSAEPPSGDGWIHELKYDGYRTQVIIDGGYVRVFTRNGHDWSDRYKPVLDVLARLEAETAVIDGEMVVMDPSGHSDFNALKSAIARRPQDLTFVPFDLLHLNGEDIRHEPLCDRRARMFELVDDYDPMRPQILPSDHIDGAGAAIFKMVDDLCLEGIVSKKKSSAYRSGYSKAWLKTKCMGEDEFVVIGVERVSGSPATAMLARDREGDLEYVGGAMITLTDANRDRFWSAVERLETPRPAIPIAKKGAQWLKPEMRVRARYLKGAGKLRHATLSGLIL